MASELRNTTDGLVTIPMEQHHRTAVKELWQRRLAAPDDRVEAWLDAALDEEQVTETFVASAGGQVRGFGVCTFAGPDWLYEYLDHPDVAVDVWLKTGVLEAIAVDEDYESRGIATQLVRAELQYLRLHGVDGVVAVSWDRDGHVDSRPLFRKVGLKPVTVVDDYYEQLDEDMYCVDCDGGCTCGATVFKAPITEVADGQ